MAVTPSFAPSKVHVGIASAVAAATVLYATATALGESYGLAFFSIPLFLGIVAGALCFRQPYRTANKAVLIALLISIVTLREGVICVLFSLPITLPMTYVGAYSGSKLAAFASSRRARNASVLLLLVAGGAWQAIDGSLDDPARHPRHVAEAEAVIDGAPSEVFSLLTETPLRVAPRWPWYIRVGLPMPERMTVEEPRVGGRVRFDYPRTTVFAHITRYSPPRELAYAVDRFDIDDLPFHVTRLGRSPDYGFRNERIEDWLTIEDTRYRLEATADGRTTLRRRVAWRRHLSPGLYFGWLQQTVIERGQERLLEAIAEQARARFHPSKKPSLHVAGTN